MWKTPAASSWHPHLCHVPGLVCAYLYSKFSPESKSLWRPFTSGSEILHKTFKSLQFNFKLISKYLFSVPFSPSSSTEIRITCFPLSYVRWSFLIYFQSHWIFHLFFPFEIKPIPWFLFISGFLVVKFPFLKIFISSALSFHSLQTYFLLFYWAYL